MDGVQEVDQLSAAGADLLQRLPVFDPPAFEVLEVFGELELPLLRDLPFAHEPITGAARYLTCRRDTFAYNVSGTWAPVRDVRFRGNYSQSVRVPTLGDLFTPPTQSFAFLQDPFDILFIGLGPNRAANCAAAGVPVGFINALARSQTTEIALSGNPFLEEETSNSLTLGVVLTPRWVPGLSVTIDYYAIDLENRIETLASQTILNQCFDLPDQNFSSASSCSATRQHFRARASFLPALREGERTASISGLLSAHVRHRPSPEHRGIATCAC